MKQQLNRRSFLTWGAGVSGALAASGILQNGLASTAHASTAGPEGNTAGACARPDMIVTTEWLAQHMGDPGIRIVEVSAMEDDTYPEGHIPGSVFWPWKESLWDQHMREFVRPRDFAALMSRSGVTPDTTVVFYSDRCQFGTYALWTCLLRGHSNVKVVDGSRTRWVDEGRPMTTAVPEVEPADYPVQPPNETWRIDRNDVLAGLGDPDRVILDGRTPEEYDGLRVKPYPGFDHGAVRKGRIPGAKHLFYGELINEDESWKPIAEIRKAFEVRGATPDKDIVSYCRTGHRASFLWFTAHFLLGYPRVRSYDGSWLEWGNMVGMPIEMA
jgi:thiosulfate/3-mercaptopyruvate sulfurtransferase